MRCDRGAEPRPRSVFQLPDRRITLVIAAVPWAEVHCCILGGLRGQRRDPGSGTSLTIE